MEPLIVDCDVLEAAKENVQPLAAGRRVTALSDILATPHAKRDAKLAATRSRLRLNVQTSLEDQDDDTLEAYCTLVYWTLENYPQGNSAESGLLELLEEATRVLKDDQQGRWKSELKYLKLWTLYASYVEKPTIIYKFLLANDVGVEHALLYEEYGSVLERNNRRTQADEIFRLGIARQADPCERLQKRYKDFQKRMMVSSPTIGSPPEPPAPRAESVITQRPATDRRSPLGEQHKSPPTRTTPIIAPSAVIPSSSSSNSRMQIFVDPAGTAGDSNAYPELGTRKTRVKENTRETGKLGGTTIKQAGKTKRIASASGASSSKMAIFRDTPEPPSSGAGSSKMAIFRDTPDPSPPAASSSKMAIFRDTPVVSSSSFPTLSPGIDLAKPAAAPKFVPFRDESAEIPVQHSMFSETVMKAKAAVEVASQAEALRKDPLKNYTDLDTSPLEDA
ncbi:Mad3/BUB1 homology region 1-domain-containing protein [Pterulicium gracile]|uniref:Mad3/BUB1 homology region 1-domain-containing protein n=1 Tax=Pterulicium gracile TaxID=1884261 RepID=A0A5C3QKG2_9AGAR|nr:Mad3/BUB1 homology region 1-domain-containing protein [Pterula gracilis]